MIPVDSLLVYDFSTCITCTGDIEKGIPEDAQKDANPGAAVVETSKGTQEVDFKTLTPEEAFEVLGVRRLTVADHCHVPSIW